MDGSISLFNNWFSFGSFHLGLFAFGSGYFFVKNYDKPILDVLKKKFISLIVPLYVWNLIYGIVIMILHKFGFQFGKDINFESLILLPLYNGHQFILNLGSWFLVPLFMIQFFSIFLVKLIKKRTNSISYGLFLFYLLLGMLGVYLAIEGYRNGFLLLLVRSLIFLPFFGFGILYKEKLEIKIDKIGNLTYFLVLLLVTLGVIYYRGKTRRV